MSTLTPRTDAERAKTLTPAYEHEGAEWEAWNWARKLEKSLRGLLNAIEPCGNDHLPEYEEAQELLQPTK